MKVLLWHPISMHRYSELELENPDHEREPDICSHYTFDRSDFGDRGLKESTETDDSSVYTTPILSPTSSVASFQSCFSTWEDFEAVSDSPSREEDDDTVSPKHDDVEIEALLPQGNWDDSVFPQGKESAFDPAPVDPPNENPIERSDAEKNAEHTNGQLLVGQIEIDPPDREVVNKYNGKDEGFKHDEDEAIMETMGDQFRFLVKKLLEAEGIPFSAEESGDNWLDVVSSLSWKASKLIKPSVNDSNPMDPRLHVKIKCLACGSPSQSQLIKGLVFKKNTAHRRMPSSLQNPRLLLFQGDVGQKATGLSSLDSMEQEMDYLKAMIRLMDACHPGVVLVEKTVSRDFLEYLLKNGVTLVIDMKLHRLKRISLCTGSPLIAFTDIIKRTELKQCDYFHIEKFFEEHMCNEKGGKKQIKTLMFFEGCSKPLGCTILLKGDKIENLKRVKRAVKLAVYAAHHLMLERSFIETQRKMFKDGFAINDSLPPDESDEYLDIDFHGSWEDIHISTEEDGQTCSCRESTREISPCENCAPSVGLSVDLTQLPSSGSICNFLDIQSILTLNSRQCLPKGIICQPSHLSRIIHYGRSDQPLGKFLRRILIDKENLCALCNEVPQAHSYSYTHHNGNLTIMVQRIPPEKHLPGKVDEKIWMWARHVAHDSQKSTRKVLMSDSAQRLSFGKFLELSFSRQSNFGKIYHHGHLPYKDWILFFGLGSYAAMFVYSPIHIYTARQPPQVLDLSRKPGEQFFEKEATDLRHEAEELFSDVASLITRIKSEPAKKHNPRIEVNQVECMWRAEKFAFEDCLTKIMNNEVESGNRMHSLPFLSQVLLLEQYIWDCRIDSLCSIQIEEVNKDIAGEEIHEVNGEVAVSGDDSHWSEKSNPLASSSHFLIWKPFSEIVRSYEGGLWGESSQKFDFLQSYTPLHLPKRQRLVNGYEKWVHFPRGKDLGIISVSEDEISSIISYALCLAHDFTSVNEKKTTECKTTGLRSSVSCPSALSDELLTANSLSVDHRLFPHTLHQETRVPIGKGTSKNEFTVISLFAEQFLKLRSSLCLSEMSYVASMRRCKGWNAQGGKSKALFAKSLDGRLVIKQINRSEFDSFLKFAPEYFKYLYSSLSSGSQTCLAKILGMYQVKQMKNGKETKTELVVMENLLHGLSVSRVYDLKGSVFSRFVAADSGDPEKVLLDQNFMNDMGAHPFYVTLGTKRLLQRAIWNDTSFLTSRDVMDYSLLIGVDEKKREVVFGIIDYLRQYTWDKKLETWAKASWVVPKNELPTVISPGEYKKRFRKFMSRYFLTIPDAS